MTIIGIDLGTTTSEACYFKNNSTCMIKNYKTGNDILLSVVGIDPKTKEIVIGCTLSNGFGLTR